MRLLQDLFFSVLKTSLFTEQVDGMSCEQDVVCRIFCLFVLIAYRTLQHPVKSVETHHFTPVRSFGAAFVSDFVSEIHVPMLPAPKCLGPYFEC